MSPDVAGRLLAGVVTVLVAYGALFGGAEMLRRRGIRGETTRSLVHACAGLLALGLPCLFSSPWPVVLMAMVFAGAMLASEWVGSLGSIHDVSRPTLGAPLYPIGIAAAFVLTGGQVPGYPVAVLTLALGDPAASLAGRRLARQYASIWGTRRSLEGSACAWLVSTAVTAVVLLVSGGTGAPPLLPLSIAVGLAVALAEAASPYGFDNVAIPVMAATILDAAGMPGRVLATLLGLATITLLGTAWRRPVVARPARGNGRLR